MHSERHDRRRGGLTLIEVLIAIAILATGMTAMLTAASRCVAVMRKSRYYQDAQWTLNMGELEHPLFKTDDIEEWNVTGVTYDNGLTYSREVVELEDGIEEGLFLLRSRATWSDHGRQSFEERVHFVYDPEFAEEDGGL